MRYAVQAVGQLVSNCKSRLLRPRQLSYYAPAILSGTGIFEWNRKEIKGRRPVDRTSVAAGNDTSSGKHGGSMGGQQAAATMGQCRTTTTTRNLWKSSFLLLSALLLWTTGCGQDTVAAGPGVTDVPGEGTDAVIGDATDTSGSDVTADVGVDVAQTDAADVAAADAADTAFDTGPACDPAACDDKNPCTDDGCDAAGAACTHTNNVAACDDGDACTTADACAAGACAGGPAKNCDDGKTCTADSCDKTKGCVNAAIDPTPCDDGNGCTVGETCKAGTCGDGTANPCDDGNPCTDDLCDIAKGCSHNNNTAVCNDGDACTSGDVCKDGTCSAGTATTCSDGNPCTDDNCDKGSGNCVFLANAATCSDGNDCTSADGCVAGSCLGTPSCGCTDVTQCNDDNACTADSCDKGACSNVALADAATCSDGNDCTVGDACATGKCAPGQAKSCDDGNPCTDDACQAGLGCVNAANTAKCDDGIACTTGDVCVAGLCGGVNTCNCKADADCDDKNACTADTCLGGKCVNKALDAGAACEDGNGCTSGDKCQGGSCVSGAAVVCNDNNPCTDDLCDPKTGKCATNNNTSPCDDSNACTLVDLCTAGKCQPGAAKVCDDKNGCTTDSCDPTKGCSTVDNTAACDDGSACTTADTCAGGKCVGGIAPNCDDKNPCTDDSCDIASGCLHVANTSVCSDNNACTLGDSCKDTACVPGEAINCGDGNPCTDDACDPAKGCSNANNSASCDDNDACTTGDTCAAGACTMTKPVNCDDSNPCTGDSCDKVKGCVHTDLDAGTVCLAASCAGLSHTAASTCTAGVCLPGEVTSCDDGNGCTTDICDGAKGCTNANNSTPCSDSNACTAGDTCSSGLCISGNIISCDDKNGCTNDSCDAVKGCEHTANSLICDDNNACTSGDVCTGASCIGSNQVVCDDKNACTADSCDPTKGCVFTNTAAACDDQNACTSGDLCGGGKCAGTGVTNCDDKNVCTTDSCDVVNGCQHLNVDGNCDDGSLCTQNDKCGGGLCVAGAPLPCNDNNSCTTDSCDPIAGCVFKPNTNPCDDGDPCTANDACNNGKCLGGGKTVCDDKNVCTTDVCDAVKGCTFTNNTLACDDNNNCTNNDVCGAGKCAGVGKTCDDGNPCTKDGCDGGGACLHTTAADGTACTAVTCTGLTYQGAATCSAGTCGSPPATSSCDDGNACTTDTCSAVLGCQNANNTVACSDNNACTNGDACAGGSCQSGAVLVCFDNNPCTDDVCDKTLGCQFKANNAPCSDNNACTNGDACVNSKCAPGIALNCNDNDPCTNDSCDVAKACLYVFNTAGCNDGNSCTTADTCDGKGNCVGGVAPNCNDNNPCTTDSCDKVAGCLHVNNTSPCNDANACTTADVCTAGVCVGGVAPVCDDGNPCTTDSCNKNTGCVNAVQANGTVCAAASCNVLTFQPAGTCTTGKCVVPATQSCDDKLECTVDACTANAGCANTAKAFGSSCASAAVGQNYAFCAGPVCTGVEMVTYQTTNNASRGVLTGIDRVPAGNIYPAGSDNGLQGAVAFPFEGIMANLTESPLGLQSNANTGKRAAMTDVRLNLSVGANMNVANGTLTTPTFMVFNAVSGLWANGGPTTAMNHPLRAVDEVVGANGNQIYYFGGDAETSANQIPTFGRATLNPATGAWGNTGYLQVTTSAQNCNNTFAALNIADVFSPANNAVFAVGSTVANAQGISSSMVAYWNGQTQLNCGNVNTTGTAVANTNDFAQSLVVQVNANANPPTGAFQAIHGSSNAHVVVAGTLGTIYSFDNNKWTLENPGTIAGNAWGSDYNVHGVYVTATDAWLAGTRDFNNAANTTCREGFVLHGSFAAGKWTWNTLVLLGNDAISCGTNLAYTGVLRAWIDGNTGSVYFVGSQGADAANKAVTSNPVNQIPLVLRIKTK